MSRRVPRVPVGDLPRDRQQALVLNRALAHIWARREELAAQHALRRDPSWSPPFYVGWPLSLADPRWVVEHIVDRTSAQARAFRLDAAERAGLADAVLAVLALEAT